MLYSDCVSAGHKPKLPASATYTHAIRQTSLLHNTVATDRTEENFSGCTFSTFQKEKLFSYKCFSSWFKFGLTAVHSENEPLRLSRL